MFFTCCVFLGLFYASVPSVRFRSFVRSFVLWGLGASSDRPHGRGLALQRLHSGLDDRQSAAGRTHHYSAQGEGHDVPARAEERSGGEGRLYLQGAYRHRCERSRKGVVSSREEKAGERVYS